MADSCKLDILKRLTAHLQGVTPANGYEFDLSESVFRGRWAFGESDPSPLVSINESLQGDINVEAVGFNRIERQETWIIFVQGWLKSEDDNPVDVAYQLEASVMKRLSDCVTVDDLGNPIYPDAYMLGRRGYVADMTIGPGIVSSGQRGGDPVPKAFFYLPVGITLIVDVSDPFLPEES